MNSYRHPEAVWRGSPNYSPNRDGHYMAPEQSYIVLHTMVGTMQSADSRFQNPNQQASAHYGVGYHGDLWQWVDEKDAAWHAGDYMVNLDSIGIEHEDMGAYNSPRPDALYQRSSKLVAEICKRYGVPCQRGDAHAGVSGCIDHRTVYATACPDSLDTNRIIHEAQMILAGQDPYPPQPSQPPDVQVQEDDDMLYVGPRHDHKASFPVFAGGHLYRDPSSAAMKLAALSPGASVSVVGYLWSSSAIQSADLSAAAGEQPGPDFLWWITDKGEYAPDAYLDTSAMSGAPGPETPANEPMNTYFALASSGGSPPPVGDYATKDELAAVAKKIPTGATTTLHAASVTEAKITS